MNSTIGHVNGSTTWKRLKLEYVTAVGGLALAIGAFAGLSGIFQRENAPLRTAPVATPKHSATLAAHRTPVFFVVSDAESARHLQSVISYEAVHPEDYRVIVIEPADQQILAEAMLEQVRASTQAKFIDLRESAVSALDAPPMHSNGSASEPAVAVETPATIAAGEAWQHGVR